LAATEHLVSNNSILLKAREVGVGALGETWEHFARKNQNIYFSCWMRFFCKCF